jgi:hypothetical protein
MQRFLRDRLENVGIKRASQKSAGVTQLLVSNNRYESAYAAAGPGFSPEARAVFARSAVGDDLHLRQMFFPRRRIRTPAESRIRSAPMAPKSDRGTIRSGRSMFLSMSLIWPGRAGLGGAEPETTGRPACHPATPLKIYVYGYLNRVQSSRRLVAGGSDQPIPAPWPDRIRHVSTAINGPQ